MSKRSEPGGGQRGRRSGEDQPRVTEPGESDASVSHRDPADTDGPPTAIRVAGALTTLEGVVALVIAVVLVVRGLTEDRHDAFNGIGTALWLAIIFGGVLAGGVALLVGRRWGRAISLVAQILLLPVSYYLFTSHQPWFAVPLAVLALITLVGLFTPASIRWLAGDLEMDEPTPAPARRAERTTRRQRGPKQ
ncbi:hypothetical protein [Gordonia polyisoprenivorans]|uniref:hypothetical protein n=1 Tax=Gordonia polyisoprenivorans TaxID=84595 RepID=UPI0003782D7E